MTSDELLEPAAPGAEDAAAEIRAAWKEVLTGAGGPDDVISTIAWWAGEPWHEREFSGDTDELLLWLDEARPYFDRISAALAAPSVRFPVKVDEYGMLDGEDRDLLVKDVGATLQARAWSAPDAADRLTASRAMESMSADLAPHAAGELERLARELVASYAEFWGAILQGWAPTYSDGTVGSGRTTWEHLEKEARRIVLDDCAHGCGVDHEWYSASVTANLEMSAELALDSDRWPRYGDPPPLDARPHDIEGLVGLREALRQHEAALALARVALAAKVHRDATGRWPESLDDVAAAFDGATPSDPFGDAQFAYEVADHAVRIASVGRDPTDSPLTEAGRHQRGLVWEFPRSTDAE